MPYINKNTAQQIVNAVKDVCSYDINYIDTNGTIIASTDVKRIGTYHEIGFAAARDQKTMEVYENDVYDGTLIGINIPFLFHGKTIGVIGITGNPDSVRQYAHLALRIMKLLLREKELDASNELKRIESSYIARILIQGTETSHPHIQQFLEQKKLSENDRYIVVLIQLCLEDRSSNITSLENKMESLLSSIPRSFYSYDYPDQYILIIEEQTCLEQRRTFEELTQFPAKIAIGSSHRLSNIHKSYADASTAIKATSQMFVDFNDLYIELLLSEIPFSTKESYLNKTIQPLGDKDLELLFKYYENNMSLKQTAEQLFLHKNTLQYQLAKIHEKTGLDPRRFQDAATLYVAMKLKNIS